MEAATIRRAINSIAAISLVLACEAHVAPPLQAQEYVIAQADANNAQGGSRWKQMADEINANTVMMVTGQPSLTYMAFGYDMTTVLDDGANLRVLVILGKGGWQNVRDIRFLRGVDLGLAQTNVLGYYKRTGEIGNVTDKIVYISKLYNEEVHFLVRSDIKDLKELDGKKVNFNTAGSGTQLSARDIFGRLGIKAIEQNMGQKDGLEKLESGEIAATVLSSGKPSPVLVPLKSTDGYRILSVPYGPEFQSDYLPSKLTHEDYPNLIPEGESIQTVAVGTLLICYNWPQGTDRYRRVAKFVEAFFSKFDEFLKPPRHPKWQDTNIYSTVSGWERFPAAQEWLDKNRQKHLASRKDKFGEFLAARNLQPAQALALDPDGLNSLFEQFVEWSQHQPQRTAQ